MATASIEVELWTWALDVDDAERAGLYACLSGDERARAERFVFERDRQRFVTGRGRLREILAHVQGESPAALQFAYAAHGKPRLATNESVHFNLSHSEGFGALAVSRSRPIGVDIEFVRPLREDVAERFFSQREVVTLKALPAHEQLAAFYRCWTRKEAVLKAMGEGLMRALDSFDVSLEVGVPPRVERMVGEADPLTDWRLLSFDPAPGFVGAIACRTGGNDIVLRWGVPKEDGTLIRGLATRPQ